ncbi:MAG TPA: hypothetical protein VFL80_03255 [Thermoanaerobaculia bacterium]|nr:hypothetical protein [Thermoanaerobaculia bacterium]
MSVRDDTSRHIGDHPPPSRGRRIVFFVVVFLLAAAVTAALFARYQRVRGWYELKEVRATSDEGYLYLLLVTGGSANPDWSRLLYRIALDTYDARLGERALPAPYPATVASGAEFLIEVGGPQESALLVTPTYNPYPDGKMVEGKPVVSPQKPGGAFERLMFESNRERFGRDGKRFAPITLERGKLHFAEAGRDARTNLRTDIAVGTQGALEFRIPWSLLNVSDPSTRRVLHGPARSEDSPTRETQGIRIYAYAFDKRKKNRPPVDQLPSRWRGAPLYAWQRWEEPKYQMELKQSAQAIASVMKQLSK